MKAAGTSVAAVGVEKLAESGILYESLSVLGGGAILSSRILASVAVLSPAAPGGPDAPPAEVLTPIRDGRGRPRCLVPRDNASPQILTAIPTSRVSYRLRAPPQIIASSVGSTHRKVRAALQAILCPTHAGKALKDELAGLRRFRFGHVRIVYRIAASRVIELVAFRPRERIYEAIYRLIAKEPHPGRAGH